MKNFMLLCSVCAAFIFVSCSNENETVFPDNSSVEMSEATRAAIGDFISRVEGNSLSTRSVQTTSSSLRRLLTDLWDCQGRNGNCSEDVIIKPPFNGNTDEGIIARSTNNEFSYLEALVESGILTKEILKNTDFPDKVFYIYRSVLSEDEIVIPVIID